MIATQQVTTQDPAFWHNWLVLMLMIIAVAKQKRKKGLKILGPNGIRTQTDLCDAGAVLHQLSYQYQVNCMGAGHHVGQW